MKFCPQRSLNNRLKCRKPVFMRVSGICFIKWLWFGSICGESNGVISFEKVNKKGRRYKLCCQQEKKSAIGELPKSKLSKAFHYALNNREGFWNYLEDGNCSISNSLAENCIRPFVIGRKNWLFSGSPKGAEASAGIYTLVETAKLRRDEEVSLTILSKICKTLHADFGDIVEYVPDAEIWDLYNENRELLGKDHIRGEQLPIDGYHLVVHVWIRNSKGEYLISQRSANRPTYPLMWECVGGSVVKGEDSLQGAIRETKEEVGVDLIPESGQVLFTKTRKIIDGKIFNDIMDVWLFEYDGEVDLGNATTDEVTQVAWMNREQIKELFDANMFVDTLEYFFTEVDK